jgi:hypothetical protein
MSYSAGQIGFFVSHWFQLRTLFGVLRVARFQTTFLGSRAVAGSLVSHGLLASTDKDGRSLSDVLYMHGFDGSEAAVAAIAKRPEEVKG